MSTGTDKTIEILISTERVADQILVNKQELVELDKKRQNIRQALRETEKNDENKVWITVGSNLFKMEKIKALTLLTQERDKIEAEIKKLHGEQKLLVNKLRDLEQQAPIKGFDLQPLNTSEISALRSNLSNF